MRRRRSVATLALLAAVLAIGCDGSSASNGAPGEGAGGAGKSAKGTPYLYVLQGPRPWNGGLYYALNDEIDRAPAYPAAALDEHGRFVMRGEPGDAFHLRSERDDVAAVARMLWTVEARGRLGEGTTVQVGDKAAISIAAPERASVHVVAPANKGGPDFVTFYDEETGTSACAIRDPTKGVYYAMWDAESGTAFRNIAPRRPWVLDEFSPGKCVIAARTEGHQWTAVRADLQAGGAIDLNVGMQRTGGGSIVCEDAGAVLYLAGQLPLPSPRRTTDLRYRSTWEGVPPGTHRVRHSDGRELDVTVTDGEETRIGR